MKDIFTLVVIFLTFFGGGLIFVAEPFFQRSKRKRCTQRIMAEYKTCKTVYAVRSMYNTYIPCFSYVWNGQEYHSMPLGANLSKRKIMEYHSGQQYEVCINPGDPQLMCLPKENAVKGMVQFLVGLGLIGSGLLFFLSCLTGCSAIPKEDGDTTVSYAWEQIILEHGDYDISIETPGRFNSEPPSGVDWSTTYENQDTNSSVNIDFYFREDSFLEQKSDLKADGIILSDIKLWDQQACYYLKLKEFESDENETLENEIIIALIPLENDTYIKVEMIGKDEVLLDSEKLLEDEAFQDAVNIEISEHE